jgi:hypothetical protein
MRKAFNFYRSYYDVVKELPDKEKLIFLMALIQRQFEGVEPTLTGQSKFAYISQKHSIDSQVIGYEAKTGIKLTPTVRGTEGGSAGGIVGGSVQEEGKEKVKEKVERASKILFKDSEIFDKVKFKEAFPLWTKEKLSYYYLAAEAWSGENKKKIDWVATVRVWAARDEKEGKLKFTTSNPQNQEIFKAKA